MTTLSSRRQFLRTSAAAALLPASAAAIDPIKRPSARPDLKLSLAAYGFRQALDLKKPTMTLLIANPIGGTLASRQGASHAQTSLAA